MMQQQAKPGPGRFQWNRGGWFGAQVGATAWMLLMGGILFAQGHMGGAIVIALALAANGAGFWLWSQRSEREPYPSIQMMLGGCAIVALAAVLIASAGGPTEDGLVPSLPTLLVYPLLMGIFHFQEMSARGSAEDRD